uniref:HcB n=1 Tax=Scolopendra dehaani TaxID=2609776 RepID=A0A212MHU7_SCODE|nr:HcB [Scolopendra dehaani]
MAALQWFLLGLVALSLVAGEKCPKTNDIQEKQRRLVEALSYVNRPYNPKPKDHELTPAEKKFLESHVGYLPRREVYSVFDARYLPEANASLYFLLDPPNFDGFIRAIDILSKHINEDMLYYVVSVAATHRDDTRGVILPRIHDIYPDKFLRSEIIGQIKQKALGNEKDIVVDDTKQHVDYRDPYSRLGYFLNDIAMNSHHYHWHVQNSLIWKNRTYPSVANLLKERIGAAFAYMHHEMVNRFDAELLSNKLPRVTPFENWNDPILEGYAAHLIVDRYQYNYMYRPPNLKLKDLPETTRNQMRQWRDRILDSIHKGYAISKDGRNVTLSEEDGIDIIGNMVESTVNSINLPLYGNLHCYAHTIAARVADPDNTYGEDNGAMYDVATSARDPLFYRWHKYIDKIIQAYRNSLRSYTVEQLTWPVVVVEGLTVEGAKVNKIKTFWEDDVLTVGTGFTFTGPSATAKVNVRHLEHEEFSYNIQVVNNAGENKKAVFRIFLAPKYDEKGHEFDFNEQRQSMIELDKFVTELTPGKNVVIRKSSESSVTQKHEKIYANPKERQQNDHCNCGWPDNLLVPRGSYEGTEFQVFVVVTNYEEDYVPSDESCHCGDGRSYCGILFGNHPDRRPYGYPFEKRTDAHTFQDFKTPNMYAVDVSIQFTGVIKKSS